MKPESINVATTGVNERNWTDSQSVTKQWIAYLTTAAVLFAILAFGAATAATSMPLRELYPGIVFLAAVCGLTHVIFFPRLLIQIPTPKGVWFSLLLAALLSAFMVGVGYLSQTDIRAAAFPAGIAFLLPAAISLCWYCFSYIPLKNKQPWYIPKGMETDKRMSLLLNGYFFQIKIKTKETDPEATFFSVTFPGKLSLATVFCRFLYDTEGNIATADNAAQPYGWCFYAENWLGNRPLDPDKTLLENSITEDSILLIERYIP